MPESRPAVKIDFTSGLDTSSVRPKVDAFTTHASVVAGREFGFANRGNGTKIDGRKLRSRGARVQLNLKVTEEEKDAILRAATQLIQDPESRVSNIGEFVVLAVEFFRTHRPHTL